MKRPEQDADDRSPAVNVRLPLEIHRRLVERAHREERSISSLVRFILRQHFEDERVAS